MEIMSPWLVHRDRLKGNHGGAYRLKALTLNLYNGDDWPTSLGWILGGLDHKYAQAAIDMIVSYYRVGENDEDFMAASRRLVLEKENAKARRDDSDE